MGLAMQHTALRRGVASAAVALALVLPGGSAAAAISATSGERAGPPPVELSWRSLHVGEADKVALALALDRAGRRAVGDARGVVFGFPGNPMRRVALRGAIRDLAFFGDDTDHATALLAATDLGLYRIASDGRVESIAPGPGAGARAIARIAVANGVVAAATDAGAFVSPDGVHWQRLSEALPSGSVTAVALAQREGFVAAWVAIRGELWRGEIRLEAGRFAVSTPVRVAIPFASGQRPPIDIALDVGDAEVAVVFESDLVIREAADADWEQLRPTLPPGASALRLAAALDRYWLATDRGLLVAPSLRGPWRRAHDSSGSDAIFELETGPGALYAATDRGVAVAGFAGGFAVSSDVAQNAVEPPLAIEVPQPVIDPSEPDVHSVHRAALRYLSLEPERIAALRRGVSRRGWLPILSLRATHDRNRSHRWDYDQAFVSGAMRHFYDSDDADDRDLELQLVASWDLGEIAYHPEAIDVSREAREVIELRDDVLDEITQLYFERRRAISAFALQPDAPAAAEHRLRAAQLAADIDAWTGGWFGRQLSDTAP
jgi:hypothetical protein